MMRSFFRVELPWALVFVAVQLGWMVFERAMGWHGPRADQHATMTLLFAPLAISVYVFLLRAKRASLGGVMTLKEGFVSGMLTTLVVVVLAPLVQLVTHKVITPGFFPTMRELAVAKGQMTPEEAEAMFSLGSYIGMSIIGALVMGLVTSALVALALKRGPKGDPS